MNKCVILAPLAISLAVGAGARAGVPCLLAVRPGELKPVVTENGRPKFHIPAGSRLARNEHPRILMTKEDLDILKERVKDPRVAEQLEALKKRTAATVKAGRGPWPFSLAVLYKLTGDKDYLDRARKALNPDRPSFGFAYAGALDLIWDELSADERRRYSDGAVKAVAKGGSLYWRPTLSLCAAVYEGGKGPNDAALLDRMKHDHQRYLVNWTIKLDKWSAGRGGSDMAHGYNGEHAYWEPFSHVISWSHCTGEDYLGWARFPKYQSPFYFYHLLPEMKRFAVEKIGVTRTVDDPSAVTPVHSGANHLLFITFTRENDGLGLTWMDMYRKQEPRWSRDREALGRLLWLDPDQKPLDYRTLPTTRIFPTSGHVTMRSAWTEDATFAVFRCGRYGEIDGTWGRNNADNLSFAIRKHGPLAIDSGPVHGQNTQVLKFLGGGSDAGVPAVGNYGRQTIAHNSITIGDREFTHLDWRGRKTGNVVRRGGQSVCQSKDWWAKWGLGGPQKDFMEGEITAYCTHPLYDYACGDALHSYPPGWVGEITRQFIYIKPDVFVVYDRIVVGDAKDRPCWMLHSLREPRATGAEKALSAAEIGPQFIFDGRTNKPHPSPGGHFAMAGDGFAVDSGSPGKKREGRLTVRTLYPSPAECERKKVGGKHHDFEVAGIQYGLTEEGYKMADNTYAARSTVGLLGWRVELRPKTPAKSIEFLHVMQAGAGDGGAASDAVRGANISSTPSKHSITITHGGREFQLKLNRTGVRGGEIRWPEAGRMQIHMLPQSIRDHWRNYKDDPNFKAWVTDPRYRVVIEPEKEDMETMGTGAGDGGASRPAHSAPPKTVRGRGIGYAGGANAARLYRDAQTAERAGMKDLARSLYARIARDHPGTPEAVKAAAAAKRLK